MTTKNDVQEPEDTFYVFIEQNTEEEKSPYRYDWFDSLDEARSTIAEAMAAYPKGRAWIEDDYGNVVE